MLSWLKVPQRTQVARLSHIVFDDGASSITFRPPSDRFLVVNSLPTATPSKQTSNKTIPEPNCALEPPLHWHRYQDETFHVIAGAAKFYIDSTERIVQASETITVPKGAYHTFRNASVDMRLEVQFVLEPQRRDNDECFFRSF
jgi:mannose-6-phosphate isomerase-like protein (cupin superfamily)